MRTRRWAGQILVILVCAGLAHIVWLDLRVQKEFQGKRWSLPGRVYASPLDLYPGRVLNPALVENHLLSLGYRRRSTVTAPGEFRHMSLGMETYLRQFRSVDGTEPARHVVITFKQDRIEDIISADGSRAVGIVRAEPQLIGKIYPEQKEDRILVRYRDLPRHLVNGLIAVEDRGFFQHSGIDFRGLSRALWVNLRSGALRQGGSTLTQQLAKNFFLTQQRTLWRKFNELIMTLHLEHRFSKEQILEAYANEVYLGQNGAAAIHGFGTAAEFYFRKPLQKLQLHQIALLVAMVRGASFYNPYRHPQRALQRRQLVLKQMFQQGYIDRRTFEVAGMRALDTTVARTWSVSPYPHFLDLVRRQLRTDFSRDDIASEGLRIFTSLDPVLQAAAQQAARSTLARLRGNGDASRLLQTAVITVDYNSGEVVALLGGSENIPGFNRALDARRSIGSLIKPFVYLTALQQLPNLHIFSPLDDSLLTLRVENEREWRPRNYDRKFRGWVSLFDALVNSYNVPAVRLGMETGIDAVISTLAAAGYTGVVQPLPSLLLGALTLSPFEVAQLYQTIANGGFYSRLNAIRGVLDRDGHPLRRYPLATHHVLDSKATFLINFMLQNVVAHGTAKSLQRVIPGFLPLAGKTGTTNDYRDSWFAGFGNRRLSIVWLGRDDNAATAFTGASGAMQIWAQLIKLGAEPPLRLQPPEGIHWSERVHLKVGGQCQTLARVPFVTQKPPAAREFGC